MKTTLQPDCLLWARKRAGLSTSALAFKMGVKEEKVVAWEKSGELSLSQADRIASATYTPIGYLFLSNPPIESLPVKDFRTINTDSISQPSSNLLDTLGDALRRQDWYREYIVSNDGKPLEFVGSLAISMDIIAAAEVIRNRVEWNAALRGVISSWEEALSKQIDAIEEIGILVMKSGVVRNFNTRTLSVTEFRGFALSDKFAPLIFINSNDSKAAQIFTLAHELVHIWLGESGVSNLSQTYSPEISTEVFCNAVAAELIVPLAELKNQWKTVSMHADYLTRLAKYFKVSSLVILRRLRDAEYISSLDFNRLYNDELAQRKTTRPGGGGNFYRTLRARLGKRFTSALVESTLEGGTLYRDAFQLLGVKNSQAINKLAEMIVGSA